MPYYGSMDQNQKNALRKMYLLTEPAFKRIKEKIDGEKYLSDLDKQLKTILYDKNIPPYKKWLKYKDMLIKFANLKKFLKDSKL